MKPVKLYHRVFCKCAFVIAAFLFFDNLRAQQSYEITFAHEDKTVYGTLMTPAGPGKPPVIIIAPGSGANDRDATIQLIGGNAVCLYPEITGSTLKPYLQLAVALVDSGYAVLRYDKLEFTYPTNLGPISFRKLWLPVESAIDFLRMRNDIDTSQIILAGHSEGSALIPYIARTKGPVRALISLAGARTPFDSLLAYQLVHFTELCGGNIVVAQNQANQILAYFDLLRTDTWDSNTPALFGVPAAVFDRYVEVTDSVVINYNLSTAPVLFLGMGEDVNVPPVELQRFAQEIQSTDDFWSLPGLNHYMTPNDDPNVSMMLSDTIVYWLRQQGIRTSAAPAQEIRTLQVYPNPSQSTVQVDLSKVYHNINVVVVDSAGRRVFDQQFADQQEIVLKVTGIPPGLYVMHIVADTERMTGEFQRN